MIFVYDRKGVPDSDPYLDAEIAYIMTPENDDSQYYDDFAFAFVYVVYQNKGVITGYFPSLR